MRNKYGSFAQYLEDRARSENVPSVDSLGLTPADTDRDSDWQAYHLGSRLLHVSYLTGAMTVYRTKDVGKMPHVNPWVELGVAAVRLGWLGLQSASATKSLGTRQ